MVVVIIHEPWDFLLQFPREVIILKFDDIHFAEPIIQTDNFIKENMLEIGERTVKNTELKLYNYYKQDSFGAALTQDQQEQSP